MFIIIYYPIIYKKILYIQIPSVIDSIKLRMKLQELQKIHKRLSRRREIQRITFKFRK